MARLRCRLVAWKESCTACLHPSLQRIRHNNDPAIRHGLGHHGSEKYWRNRPPTQGGSELRAGRSQSLCMRCTYAAVLSSRPSVKSVPARRKHRMRGILHKCKNRQKHGHCGHAATLTSSSCSKTCCSRVKLTSLVIAGFHEPLRQGKPPNSQSLFGRAASTESKPPSSFNQPWQTLNR